MRFQFGDIVLVPFPFTDQSTTKQRPGVLVSSAAYHRTRRDLILMAVTWHGTPHALVEQVRNGTLTLISSTALS